MESSGREDEPAFSSCSRAEGYSSAPGDGKGEKPSIGEPHLPSFLESPDRVDRILLYCWLGLIALGFALIPFRGYLLNHPWVAAPIGGSLDSMVTSGAHVSQQGDPWLWPLFLGVFGYVKFLPLYLIIGRKWGDEGVSMFLGNSEKWVARVKRWERRALKWAFPILLLSSIPMVPIPPSIVIIALGNGGLSMKRFMGYMVVIATMVQGSLIYLGYRYGREVMQAINIVNHYMWYFTVALIAWVIFSVWRRIRKGAAA